MLGLTSAESLSSDRSPAPRASSDSETASLPVSAPQAGPDGLPEAQLPVAVHRMKPDHSILSLAVSPTHVFAGTEKGQIIIYSILTGDRVKTIDAHASSVLDLFICTKSMLLFSGSGDRIVNVWCTTSFKRLYSIYSTYDVGDLFSVVYSSKLETIYIGAQNTSIQWYDLKEKASRPVPGAASHPHFRVDKFFDSTGPGGYRSPRPDEGRRCHRLGGQTLEIDREYIYPYSHYGYVYCMALYEGYTCDQTCSSKEVLITGGGEGSIKIWSLDGSKGGRIEELAVLHDGCEEGNSVLCFALDQSFLYSGRLDGEINVWDLETKQLIRNLHTATGDIMTMSAGGGVLYAGGVTGLVEQFDKDHKFVSQFQAHQGKILASTITVSQETGKTALLTGGSDNAVVLWDIKDGHPSGPASSKNDELVEVLKEFVSFRSVSSDVQYKEECHRCASFLRSTIEKHGAVTNLLTSDKAHNPVIFARFRGNPKTVKERKKILFYGHYDVVSAHDSSKWNTDPFTLEAVNGHLYGRGVSDNKGPIMAAIWAAAELNATQALEADIMFLIEGEEENGSFGFKESVRKHRELIGDVDWTILANSYWIDDETPCVTYGLRGVIRATVEVKSPFPDLHSGVDGSAYHDEALKDLVALVSKLYGRKGHIEVPGFYDSIIPPTAREEDLFEQVRQAISERKSAHNATDVINNFKRRWGEPSLTVHWFQTSAPDNSTVIPYLARASISIRLVPGQSSASVSSSLQSFLQAQFDSLESNNKLEVKIDHTAEPWLGNVNNEVFNTLEEGIIKAWQKPCMVSSSATPEIESPLLYGSADSGSSTPVQSVLYKPKFTRPLYIREGGSIPAIRFLEEELGAPAAQLPIGQASDSAHLPNERLRLANLLRGKNILEWVFQQLPRR